MTKLTAADIDNLLELEKNATPGEWFYDEINYIFSNRSDPLMIAEIRGHGWNAPQDINASLIAASRNAFQKLLEEVRANREVIGAAANIRCWFTDNENRCDRGTGCISCSARAHLERFVGN